MLTPARRRDTSEHLDDATLAAATAIASGEDIARANRWLGGCAAVGESFDTVCDRLPRAVTVLDIASGVGDLAATVVATARRRGVTAHPIALDRRVDLLSRAQTRGVAGIAADATRLPIASASVDVVLCAQFLHHLDATHIVDLARECTRIARHAVIIADLRRHWVAALGIWLASFPLAFHPISRHDGVASVLKGFTRDELAALLTAGAARPIAVRPRPLFRLTAIWGPAGS